MITPVWDELDVEGALVRSNKLLAALRKEHAALKARYAEMNDEVEYLRALRKANARLIELYEKGASNARSRT
jgi:pullulanase/glycogen debranching enzyme